MSEEEMPFGGQPIGDMAVMGLTLHEFYSAMLLAGFSADQALRLTIEFMRGMFENARGNVEGP